LDAKTFASAFLEKVDKTSLRESCPMMMSILALAALQLSSAQLTVRQCWLLWPPFVYCHVGIQWVWGQILSAV